MRIALLIVLLAAVPQSCLAGAGEAAANGLLFNEGLNRCHRYLQAWLATAEPTTGLIPRNLTDSPYWNGKDSAADNYAFMVLSADLTERRLVSGRLRAMLEAERRLTVRPGWLRLTDDFNLEGTPGLQHGEADAQRIFFNSAEYAKDGLMAVTEWMGPSPWSERMFELIDDSFALAATATPFGCVPLAGIDTASAVEINGDYLQVLARAYWMSGCDEKYLRWGVRLADLHLLPDGRHHPTRDFDRLRLSDHGVEIVSGLCEFYVTLYYAGLRPDGEEWAAKREAYRPHIHEMLDRILEVGRNEDGLFCCEVDPRRGEQTDPGVADTWGYLASAYHMVASVDGDEAYREAVVQPLAALNGKYRGRVWTPRGEADSASFGTHDGYADAIEGALNLYHAVADDARVASVPLWIDAEIRTMWAMQKPDGLIESWHGDGNFARTTLMYCLWKSQGVTARPWRADLRLGAVREGRNVRVVLSADQPWSGVLVFDRPRHKEDLGLPMDEPRLNRFPEWFAVDRSRDYTVVASGDSQQVAGERLIAGWPVSVGPDAAIELTVLPPGDPRAR